MNETVSFNQPGDKIGGGRYLLKKILGRGGMGMVWLALDEKLNELIALKLVCGPLAYDPSALAKLRCEVARTHTLTHPNILRVHDLHEHAGEDPFIAMEYVDGPTLSQLAAERPQHVLPWSEVAPLAAQLCDALAYAHAEGVVHRDLKPGNVMLDRRGRLKLADFGIAAAFNEENQRITTGGGISGTPAYMSPQQINGDGPTPSDDLYGLGATLFELLTSEPPFARGDIFHQAQNKAVPTLHQRNTKLKIQNPVPPDVELTICACLAKEPAKRPKDAREVARRLGVGKGGAAHAPAFRDKLVWALSAAVVIGVLTGIVAFQHGRRTVENKIEGLLTNIAAAAPVVPADSVSGAAIAAISAATKDAPFVNSLGMKFVPVPITGGPTDGKRVLFSVWETRVQDYEVFTRETGRAWPKPDFEQGPTHPAVNVSWDDAQAFCVWLTERERKSGRLGAEERYRLPTDHEWSCAVGIGDREDPAIESAEKAGKIPDAFPWGAAWPPPPSAGNYSGEEVVGHERTPAQKILAGYRDDFPETAPVGSFAANPFGIFDLGGNAAEWCRVTGKNGESSKLVRGASFATSSRAALLASYRSFSSLKRLNSDYSLAYGLRIVLDGSADGAGTRQTTGGPASLGTPPSAAGAPAAILIGAFAGATKDAPFVNSLGMKFVPVPITGGPTDGKRVLFSVWETRVQDYETFASETKRERPTTWVDGGPTHPATMVSWLDAKAFCEWLTEREHKAGLLTATQRYRLPTDHEWSCAVGIGGMENPAQAPMEKHRKIADVFLWGNTWPPPAGTGNFSGEESIIGARSSSRKILSGYRDEFRTTAPVGSFAADRFGLFDLAGNLWEWCEDSWSPDEEVKVLRGGAFNSGDRLDLLSSNRKKQTPTHLRADAGIRPVLADAPRAPTTSTTLWRDALAESPLKDVIATAEHTAQGYRLPANNHWPVSLKPQGSGAVRVRATSFNQHFVNLFVSLDDGRLERIRFRSLNKQWVLSHGASGREEPDFAAQSGSSPLDERPHELLFARMGGRLRVMVDDQLILDRADPSSAPGRFVLDIYPDAKLAVEKVEYLELDGLSEPEALKAVGLPLGN